MRKIMKRILGLTLSVGLLFGIGFSESAYAATWQQTGYDWEYLNDDNTFAHGWKLIDNKLYYFDSKTNLMKYGWFYDNSTEKWYYATSNGDVPTLSNATTTFPTELEDAATKIDKYINKDLNYDATNNIKGELFIVFEEANVDSYVRYYYRQSTGNVYKIENGNLIDLATNQVMNTFTQDQAVQLVKDYLVKNNKYVPTKIVCESDNGDTYSIHCYDVINAGTSESHTATSGWYYVNKSTREIKSMY